jgi:hypothetical protein
MTIPERTHIERITMIMVVTPGGVVETDPAEVVRLDVGL